MQEEDKVMNIAEELDKIIKEIDKDKQRIVMHPDLYNKYKDKIDRIETEYFAIVIINSSVPVNKVFVVESERNMDKRLFSPFPALGGN
jgi:hypothetical protein